MTPLEILLCSTLIFLSGFMSSSEAALFSLSRFQLKSLKERFRAAHRRIRGLLGDPAGLLITVLVVNEVVNIALSTLFAQALANHWEEGRLPNIVAFKARFFSATPDWLFQLLLSVVITAPIVLIICDLTPKVLAARANMLVSVMTVRPLTAVYILLKPVRIVLKAVIRAVSTFVGKQSAAHGDPDHKHPLLKEEEFLHIVEEGHKEGAIQDSELGLIRNVFDLDDRRVADIYTPWHQVQTLSAAIPVKLALQQLRAGHRFSRIPVFGTTRRQAIGVVYSKDLLLTRLREDAAMEPVSSLMRRPYTVSPDTKLNAVFRKFRQNRVHLAIVERVPGEALGIVTMSDVLDALFEDLYTDEDDREEVRG